MTIKRFEFLSAGFLITRSVPRPPSFSKALIPDQIISASDCIVDFVPDTWCIEWTQDTQEARKKKAATFELETNALEALTRWVTPQFGENIGWPNVCFDLDIALQIVRIHLKHLSDVRVLQLALHQSHINEFCRVAEPPPQEPGFAPNGRQGVHESIRKGSPLTEGGKVLGFEPLVFEYSLSCSWLCNGLETAVSDKLNIKPNQFGFIQKFEEACKCVEYISREEVGAEPGLWLPWLIVDHSEKVQQSAADGRG